MYIWSTRLVNFLGRGEAAPTHSPSTTAQRSLLLILTANAEVWHHNTWFSFRSSPMDSLLSTKPSVNLIIEVTTISSSAHLVLAPVRVLPRHASKHDLSSTT